MVDMLIEIPYGLAPEELQPDPASKGYTDAQELMWLHDEVTSEDELSRVLTAAVCLYHHQERKIPLGECLHTAIIWERG